MAEAKYENMTHEELQSMLKNNISFRILGGEYDESLQLTEEDIKWWRDAKFGLFIHWGVYAVIGKGEWAYHSEGFKEEDYRKIAENDFCPKLSPEEITDGWLSIAEEAGMKYAVMVTRHHDGFAMWDSKCSYKDYTSQKLGPKADYVRAFTDSCRKFGFYTGLYYSPMDWRFPGYFDPKGKPENAQLMKEQCYNQIRELLTDYGHVDILWYDGAWLAHKGVDADAAWFWEPLKLNKMARELMPKIMTTPRSGYRGDFQCYEGGGEIYGPIVPLPWEKNMSVSTSWGYKPNDRYDSAKFVINMLSNAVCRDGNMLLNFGPDPDGRVPEEVKKLFEEIGVWMRKNGDAVYGTRGGPVEPVDRVYGTTQKDNFIFVHILDKAEFSNYTLPISADDVLSAEDMNGVKIKISSADDGIKLSVPESDEDVIIVRLTVK